MSSDLRSYGTRVWWDNSEVAFVGWTEKALLFSWCDARETAVQMPRGVVYRLLQKGVLRIEGEIPDWLYLDHPLPGLYPVTRAEEPPEDPKAKQRSERFNIISRIIRKLTGADEGQPLPKTAAAAVQGVGRPAVHTARSVPR